MAASLSKLPPLNELRVSPRGVEAIGADKLARIIEHVHEAPFPAASMEAQEVDELRRKLHVKSLFVRSVSHEIRTHLNVVFSALLWLEFESASQSKIFRDTIQMTMEACTSAVDELNDMLAYEKLDENILTVESSPVAVAPFIDGTIKPFNVQAQQKKIRIVYEESEALQEVFVSADEHKLSQVLRNLLANAVKFTLANGTVTVRAMRMVKESKEEGPKDWIRIEVIDDGYGITKVIFRYTFWYNTN